MTILAASPWQALPWFLVQPPGLPSETIERARIRTLLQAAVEEHAVTIVAAPSGFGKTIAVTDAMDGRPDTVWVSATASADTAVLVRGGLLGALPSTVQRQILSRAADEPLMGVLDALALSPVPLTIVIDDAHLLDHHVVHDLILGDAVIRSGFLHVMLVGQPRLEHDYARLIASGVASLVSADELRFTDNEAARMLRTSDPSLPQETITSLVRLADGWPIALRVAATGNTVDGVAFGGATIENYISAAVIDQLRPELTEFILATTTSDLLDPALATALTGTLDAGILLEECVRTGLFLSRYTKDTGGTVYRWHETFALHCREILRRRDPELARVLHRKAAEHLSRSFPTEAIEHALTSEAPDLAASIISRNWLRLILESHTNTLNRLCVQLPEPWKSLPEIQFVRACCCDLQGEHETASALRRQAKNGNNVAATSSSDFAQSFAELLLAERTEQKALAAERAAAVLASTPGTADHPHALFLLGWAELRLRRDPERAISMLADATTEAERHGFPGLATHARLNTLFARTYGGQFVHAERELAAVRAAGIASRSDWDGYDGGLTSFSRAYIDYWRGDFDAALSACDDTINEGGTDTSFVGLARVYQVLAITADQRIDRYDAAEQTILRIPPRDKNAVPWGAYRRMAAVRLAETTGDLARAREIGDPLLNREGVPVTHALLADFYRRAGQLGLAHIALKKITPRACPAYARVSALVTVSALYRQQNSPDASHRAFVRALKLAARESVMAPFLASDDALAELIDKEALHGGEHEVFLAKILARRERVTGSRDSQRLSPREIELLGYLRTPMTAEEIARELHLSLATVKSHRRNLYRKLGVNTRREAIRRATDI